MPDAGANCGAGIVNNPGTDDGVTIVEGHEQAETTTDPQPDERLVQRCYGEIGDECAWQDIENNKDAGGYPTQPLWSNASNSCVPILQVTSGLHHRTRVRLRPGPFSFARCNRNRCYGEGETNT